MTALAEGATGTSSAWPRRGSGSYRAGSGRPARANASRCGDGGPLTTAAYHRARQWRQQWLALFEPALPESAIPAVIGPDGAVHAGPDGLRCLAGIVVRPRNVYFDAFVPTG